MAQTAKTQKTLAVFDLDNTLTDSLTFWATAATPLADSMHRHFDIPQDTVVRTILKAPSQYRFNDIGHLITWMDARGVFPRARDPHEQHQMDMTKWALRQQWYATQKRMTHFYPGAVDTLQALRASKTDVAIYTDAEASSMIRRVWLLAHNAKRNGLIADEQDVIHMVDHFYCQPSIEDDQRILRDVDVRFTLRIKEKMSLWTGRMYKPAPDYLRVIMDDFGADAARTVMVGDTHNDGGCAVPHNASFAWAHYGARIAPEIEAAARRMASSYYKYGVADIMASFHNGNRPDVVLHDEISELRDHFAFTAGNGFNPRNGTDAGTPPRNPGDRATQNPPVYRLYDPVRSRTPRSPLGPATHLPPAP